METGRSPREGTSAMSCLTSSKNSEETFNTVISKKARKRQISNESKNDNDTEKKVRNSEADTENENETSCIDMDIPALDASASTYANRVKSNLTVYLRGSGYDITKEVKNKAKKYESEINLHLPSGDKCNLNNWKLTGECLRITCNSEQQKLYILAIDALCERPIEATEPWSLERAEAFNKTRKDNVFIGIAHGVPSDTDWNECTLENSAVWIRPLNNNKENEYCSIIIAFNHELPGFLFISKFLRIRIQKYIPRPMQCKNCWAFGHLLKHCRNRTVCEVCAEHGHAKADCQNGAAYKCINCKQRHLASSRECDKYVINLDILKLAHESEPPLSFKEAQLKWNKLNQDNQKIKENRNQSIEQNKDQRSRPSVRQAGDFARTRSQPSNKRVDTPRGVSTGRAGSTSGTCALDQESLNTFILNQYTLSGIVQTFLKQLLLKEANTESLGHLISLLDNINKSNDALMKELKIKPSKPLEHIKMAYRELCRESKNMESDCESSPVITPVLQVQIAASSLPTAQPTAGPSGSIKIRQATGAQVRYTAHSKPATLPTTTPVVNNNNNNSRPIMNAHAAPFVVARSSLPDHLVTPFSMPEVATTTTASASNYPNQYYPTQYGYQYPHPSQMQFMQPNFPFQYPPGYPNTNFYGPQAPFSNPPQPPQNNTV
jgi:hypothetical protein